MHAVLAYSLEREVEIYGENMTAIHSIEYHDMTSYFYIFSVKRHGRWFSWDEVEAVANELELPTVPVLFRGTLSSMSSIHELSQKTMQEPSRLGLNTPEGFVVRTAAAFSDDTFERAIAKYVRKGHIQTSDGFMALYPRNKAKIKLR